MFFEFISGNNVQYTLQKVGNMLAILYINRLF